MANSTSKTSVPGVYRRAKGYAYVISTGRDPETGRWRQQWVGGFRTIAEAKAARHVALTKVREGTHVPQSQLTLTEFIEEKWLPAQTMRVRPATHNLYWVNWRRVRPRLGNVKLRQVDPPRLQTLYGDLLATGNKVGGPLGARSVQIIHAFLHRAFVDAVRWGLISRNPADLVDRPSARRPEVRAWSPTEVRNFLDFTKDDRLAPLWRMIAMTGVRRGEALGLRWSDVDLEGARISIQQTLVLVKNQIAIGEPKTKNARRLVDLDSETVLQLKYWRDRVAGGRALYPDLWQDVGLVFVDELGLPLNPPTVTRIFVRAVEAAGLPEIKLHGLRHSHATAMLASGISPKIAQERLGHFSVSLTLDTYSHTLAGMQAAVANQIAELIDGERIEV